MTASAVSAAVFHRPSDRDDFFFFVAMNFKAPEACDRIDARADSQQIGTVRSKRSQCRGILAGERTSVASEVPDDMARFADQVRAIGYTDADVRQSACAENEAVTPIREAYAQLLARKDFRARVRAGRSYAEPRDRDRLRQAHTLEYLYQKVGVDACEPELCAKISPNATFVDYGEATVLLQSRCYLHLAFTVLDPALCQPLPAAGAFPHINEIYDSRDKCLETVAIYRRPSVVGRTGTYGPYPFARAGDFHASLRDIGYAESELPPIPAVTPEEYWEFVSRLRFRGSAADRDEFVRRTLALK